MYGPQIWIHSSLDRFYLFYFRVTNEDYRTPYSATWVAINWRIKLPTIESHPDFPLWKSGYSPQQVYDLFFPEEFRFLCNPQRPAVCGRFGLPEDRLWRFEFVVKPGEDGEKLSNPESLKKVVYPYITHDGSRYGYVEIRCRGGESRRVLLLHLFLQLRNKYRCCLPIRNVEVSGRKEWLISREEKRNGSPKPLSIEVPALTSIVYQAQWHIPPTASKRSELDPSTSQPGVATNGLSAALSSAEIQLTCSHPSEAKELSAAFETPWDLPGVYR